MIFSAITATISELFHTFQIYSPLIRHSENYHIGGYPSNISCFISKMVTVSQGLEKHTCLFRHFGNYLGIFSNFPDLLSIDQAFRKLSHWGVYKQYFLLYKQNGFTDEYQYHYTTKLLG